MEFLMRFADKIFAIELSRSDQGNLEIGKHSTRAAKQTAEIEEVGSRERLAKNIQRMQVIKNLAGLLKT